MKGRTILGTTILVRYDTRSWITDEPVLCIAFLVCRDTLLLLLIKDALAIFRLQVCKKSA